LKDEYFVDSKRSGRPKAITEEKTTAVLQHVRTNRASRAASLIKLARTVNLSYMSIFRILRGAKMRKVKLTRKPGLTALQKKARLDFYLKYKDWTLEDWKDVIWSDEISVVFGQRRGGERVWRTV
jgi:hypothetical protein